MDKRPDFGDDLASLNSGINAQVDDVLLALKQKRAAARRVDAPAASQSTSESVETPATETKRDDAEGSAAAPTEPVTVRKTRTTSRTRFKSSDNDESLVLENVTTRLIRETNELLTEAALRQKLKKEHPSTRQEIVEAALQDWFRKHSYAR